MSSSKAPPSSLVPDESCSSNEAVFESLDTVPSCYLDNKSRYFGAQQCHQLDQTRYHSSSGSNRVESCDIELQVTSDSGPTSPAASHRDFHQQFQQAQTSTFGTFTQSNFGPPPTMFDHYRRSSIGVEHLSSATNSGFWSSTNAWLSPNSANMQRRRSSHPKICTFDCSHCRKLMLSSVSERNLSAIDSVSSLAEGKSIEQSQSLTSSDQQLSSLSIATTASSTPLVNTAGCDSDISKINTDIKVTNNIDKQVNCVQQTNAISECKLTFFVIRL